MIEVIKLNLMINFKKIFCIQFILFIGCNSPSNPIADPILGCMDPEASNYDANAEEDNGSCIDLGCTNEEAINYDPDAEEDNGSCIDLGCTNEEAINYDPDAEEDDGSCIIVDLYDTGGYARDIAFSGSTLAVASDQNGYLLYNITDSSGFITLIEIDHEIDTNPYAGDDVSTQVEFSIDSEFVFVLDPLDAINIFSNDPSIPIDPPTVPLYSGWNLYRSMGNI